MSVTGRIANFGSSRLGAYSRWQGRVHARLYKRFGGRRFARWLRKPAFLLTVRGRTTGQPRDVMLMLVRDGDDLLVCGSNAGNPETPNWYRNLQAAGEAEVTVDGERWAVRSHELEGAERAAAWELLCAAYPDFRTYERQTDRVLPISRLTRA